MIPVEDSQYLPDSFIVEEEEEPTVASEVSMCPLEKAERILKERKRAKKLLGKTGKDEKKEGSKTKKKKKIVVLDDSSDEYT